MGSRWSNTDALARLRRVVSVASFSAGGTQSTALSGILSFAREAEAALEAARRVLDAVNAPPPHPIFGDDGSRHELRERALEALAHAEAGARHD